MTKLFHTTPVAGSVPFDKDNEPGCEFESENLQDVIEELCRRTARSASPGYQWGRSGNLGTNIWLKNAEVSSQRTGLPFDLANGEFVSIFVGNQNINTFDITFYEHDGNSTNLTSLVTVSITAARSGFFDINDFGTVAITQGKQLAARITSGSAKNVLVVAVLKGDVAI